ncbi:MAG TPA: hypothetical protein VGK21_13910 [Candidatus Angelobacter sp.]
MAEANHFESNRAIETFLPRAIDHTLAATTDYLDQFIVAKICNLAREPQCALFASAFDVGR